LSDNHRTFLNQNSGISKRTGYNFMNSINPAPNTAFPLT
jgi:hypothetical protein